MMDVFYRLHVDDKSHGSLFTLTVDSLYKARQLTYLLRGHDYVFAVLLAVTAVSVYQDSLADDSHEDYSSSSRRGSTGDCSMDCDQGSSSERPAKEAVAAHALPASASSVSRRKAAVVESILRLVDCRSSSGLFREWLAAAAREVELVVPAALLKSVATDIVSKCLHCCISYCEKMTSWKRLYNSQMTCFLQK